MMSDQEVTLSDFNRDAFNALKKIVLSNKLLWSWESIYYTADVLELTFDDIKVWDKKHKHLHALILSGLPKDKRDIDNVYSIMDQFRNEGISPWRQYELLKEHITRHHFFMDTEEMEEMKNLYETVLDQNSILMQMILELSSKNLILKQMLMDLGIDLNQQ